MRNGEGKMVKMRKIGYKILMIKKEQNTYQLEKEKRNKKER